MNCARRVWPLVLALCAQAFGAQAQPAFYESEPNDTPAQANAINGAVAVFGAMDKGDQDGFVWTVSDDDARKRWSFELQGIPGRLTIAEVVRVELAGNRSDVAGAERMMKMGTRDGLTPSIVRDLMFEPGEYLIGIAYGGGGSGEGASGAFRPPIPSLSFGEEGRPDGAEGAARASPPEPGGYRFVIREGSRLDVSKSPGSRNTRKTAQPMRLGSEFAAFETQPTAWYAFHFSEADARQRWDLSVQVPVGRSLNATLYDPGGGKLAAARSDERGRLVFPDIAPTAGTYHVELSAKAAEFVQAVASRAVGQRVDGEEAEPNDEWRLANRVGLSRPLTGRISKNGEQDFFRFALDEAGADGVLALRIESEPAGQPIELCLLSGDGQRVQCRSSSTPVELPDLVLSSGEWGLAVGRAGAGLDYRVTLDAQGAIGPSIEAEPNDAIEFASSVPANNRIKGRFSGNDEDFFRFDVVDEPQLWRFQVLGDGIHEVSYHDGAGHRAANVRAAPGQKRVRLDNVFLMPGQHFLRVSGRDKGRYTVLARRLGPPDPNGEREPNDDESRMQHLAIGQTRSGLLADPGDADHYRFFLAHWDHVRLTVQPPADGVVHPQIYWYDSAFAEGSPAAPGKPIELSGLLPPGDYHVVLKPAQVSEAEYRLSLERLPRFSCPSDCEPSGLRGFTRVPDVPPNLELEGRSGDWRDTDPYALPAFDRPTMLLVRTAEPVRILTLADAADSKRLIHDPSLGGYPVEVPAGGPYRLVVDSGGDTYRLALEFGNEPTAPAAIDPLPVELRVGLEHEKVSAFRIHGQRVAGALVLKNAGDRALELDLEAVTSDYRWQVELLESRISLPSGGTATVPMAVLVPADAWADRSVRISARARDRGHAQVEGWQDIAVDREAAPVGTRFGWPIPVTLRGGFNAAWSALGSSWAGAQPAANQLDLLRDGMVFDGSRVECCSVTYGWKDDYRPLLTLQLPGQGPIPVAGVAWNHFGSTSRLGMVRKATLLLSTDGVRFEEALRFETLPVLTEQYFPLASPVMARFARVRLDETFGPVSGQGHVHIGEWKVIAEPGFDLSEGSGFNLADPALGGHLVSDSPPSPYSPVHVLDETKRWQTVRLREGQSQHYVIGFQHNRMAQIRRIEWAYAADVEAGQKADRLMLSVSADSPVGPWQPIGEIDFAKGDATTAIELDAPVWARFVRLTAVPGAQRRVLASPNLIRVWERPTGNDYRSVLTEWGQASPSAYYELQAGLPPPPHLQAADNDSRERAARLATGQRAGGEVALARRDHWYRLQVPAGENTLTLALSGDPTVRTRIELQDEGGAPIPVRKLDAQSRSGRHLHEAVVDPGSEVFVRIYEPPRNVVFTWDTSASVIAHLPTIYNALTAFSSQVVAGQEAVNLMPFGRGTLLKNWHGQSYVLQTILNDYPRSESSSAAELALKDSTRALAPLPGSKSIVVITDGETVHEGSMWEEMHEVRPQIFGVHVAGFEGWHQDVFEDWASVGGGHYTQLAYRGEMEVAFDRASTMMRRPAGYTLEVSSEFRKAPGPGKLRVVAGGKKSAASGRAVALIFDASGSMLKRMQGKRRIDVAREVLTEAVRKHLPAGTPLALRVFGHKEAGSCRTDLEMPLAPLDPVKAARVIGGIRAMNLARTPIADSLAAVERDLKGAKGGAAIVLVTDGEETCGGDPGKVIEALKKKGLDVRVNIVGFAIGDAELEERFASWAELGGGRYFRAQDREGLSDALGEALRVPFVVYGQDRDRVAAGVVEGEPVELAQGTYRVEVASSPRRVIEHVEISAEKATTIGLTAH